ncbi:hypothetical protein JCM3766R1_002063 [Sporobolomyces carnicolor]
MSKSPKALLPSSLSFSQISRAAVQSSTSSGGNPSQQRIRRYVVGAAGAATGAGIAPGSGACIVVRQRRAVSPPSRQSPRSTDPPSHAPAHAHTRSASSLRGRTSTASGFGQHAASASNFSTSCAHSRCSPASGSTLASSSPTSPSLSPPPGKHQHSSLTSSTHSSSSGSGGPGSGSGGAGPGEASGARTGGGSESDFFIATSPLTSHPSSTTTTTHPSAPAPSSNGPSPHAAPSSHLSSKGSIHSSSLFVPSSSSNSSNRSHALPSFFGSSSLATPFRGNLVFRNGAYGIPKNTSQHTRKSAKGKEKQAQQLVDLDGNELEGGEHCLSVSVGEDAYFLRNDSLGVADGVGGWSGHAGANPARWARKFMHHCAAELARYENIDDEMFLQYYQVDPVEVMQRAFEKCLRESKDEGIIGSSTALLAVLRNDELHLANLGDCYCCVIRDNDYIFRSEEQQHSFNFPFQAGTNSKDTPGKDAQRFMVKVKKDDIVLLASDGLVDNVFSDDLLEEILRFVSVSPSPVPASTFATPTGGASGTGGGPRYTLNKFSPQLVSESLCYRAKSVYDDPRAVASPFQNRAVEEGLYYAGGKKDDVTCLIGVVGELEASPNRRDVA